MKRKLGMLLTCILAVSLMACGIKTEEVASTQNPESTTIQENEEEVATTGKITEETIVEQESSEDVTQDTNETNILVVYFSETGNTKGIAQIVADELSADIYEIIPVDEYTEDDLNYNDSNSRATIEQNDSNIRPEIDGTIDNWDQYSVIVIGHPIWWGQEPRIMDTFVESYDFTGKTVTTFCTSASSGIGNSGENLETNANSGTWLAGRRFAQDSSLEDIQEWIEELAIIE